MAIRNRKADKIKFGYFFVVKRDRKKAGQKTYEAYCLIPR